MDDKVYCCSTCQSDHPTHTLLPTAEARRALYSPINRLYDLNNATIKSLSDLQSGLRKKLAKAIVLENRAIQYIEAAYKRVTVKVERMQKSAMLRIGNHFSGSYRAITAKEATIREAYDRLRAYQRLEDGLLFYSKVPHMMAIREARENFPVPISIDFPQFERISGYLANSYVVSKFELEHSALPKLFYLDRGGIDYLVYNFETDRTEAKQLISEEFIIPKLCGFAVLPYQSVFLTGGKVRNSLGVTDLAFMFSPEHGRITKVANMRNRRAAHICLYANKAVFALSGKTEGGNTPECEIYSMKTGIWTDIAPVNISRRCASGTHFNGKIYVFGGFHEQEEDSIEAYSIDSNVWELLPSKLPIRLWKHSSCLIGGSEVLIFGGESTNRELNTQSVICNLETVSFSETAKLPMQTKWQSCWLHVALKGKALYTMGRKGQIWKYAIDSKEWSSFK